MTCVQGAASQIALNGQSFPFINMRSLVVQELMDGSTDAITGNLQSYDERWDLGIMRIGHRITLEPTPEELDVLLPLMGLTQSPTDTFTLGQSLTSFPFIVDYVTKVHTFTNCVIGRWRLQGARGSSPIRLLLDLIGKTRPTEGNAGSFSATGRKTDAPIPFSRGTMTLNSVERQFNQFVLACDFNVAQQYNNSFLPTDLCPSNIQAYLATSVPYDSTNSSLVKVPVVDADVSSFAGALAFTRGTMSSSWAMTALRPVQRMPDILGKVEIRAPLYYRINRNANTAAIVVTHTIPA